MPNVPNFIGSGTAYETADGPSDLVEVSMAGLPLFGASTTGEVPQYEWWYGCSPTSASMIVGYWDSLPGYGRLFEGDASVWYGDGTYGTRQMVASDAHITAGAENGYTYGDWHNSATYPDHESNPNCMADFMRTVNGGSYAYNIAAGLVSYVGWDNPNTPTDEHYDATLEHDYIAAYGGSFAYEDFKAEIDAGRPVLLDAVTLSREGGTDTVMLGHTIVGYGYQDDMFTVKVPGGVGDQTVGGFAVYDTWPDGTAASEWSDPEMQLFSSVIDGDGVEWWPFIEYPQASWVYVDSETYGPYDWMITDAHMLNIFTPEPAVWIFLLAMSIAFCVFGHRKFRFEFYANSKPSILHFR